MAGFKTLESDLDKLEQFVRALHERSGSQSGPVGRWLGDCGAALFHLRQNDGGSVVACILGGTGTGKSTLVNRLLQANLSAASFRRTFTAGAVAIVADAAKIPNGWLGVPQIPAASEQLPARGQSDALIVVQSPHEMLSRIALVDTPDLDGDQPAHHAQADRAFRWAQAVIFLVSPEKYQMTELLPYYRLARRYALPALFVMNKCETPEMLEDYRKLVEAEHSAAVFAIARDDAAYERPPDANLAALRKAIGELTVPAEEARRGGVEVRVTDLLGRLRDQIIGPLRKDRREIELATAALEAMETPAPGVDVNPITEQLERRLQQRSVLYLIGPGRVLDRVRQVPAVLVRLPRTAWQFLYRGRTPAPAESGPPPTVTRDLPDFDAALTEQFTIIQSRIDDIVRASSAGQRAMSGNGEDYAKSKISPDDAGKIATEELDELNAWLQRRWNATPRDTMFLLKLLRHLPGGEKLTQWTEAAPYLLALVVAVHHALFWHTDLAILSGYTVAAWITERLSNEVAGRTRQANRAIAMRFEKLAHEQIRRSIQWMESQSPAAKEIDAVEELANRMEEGMAQVR